MDGAMWSSTQHPGVVWGQCERCGKIGVMEKEIRSAPMWVAWHWEPVNRFLCEVCRLKERDELVAHELMEGED